MRARSRTRANASSPAAADSAPRGTTTNAAPKTTDRGNSSLPSASCAIETAIAPRAAAPTAARQAAFRLPTSSGRFRA
jgi:hypothetical protein